MANSGSWGRLGGGGGRVGWNELWTFRHLGEGSGEENFHEALNILV